VRVDPATGIEASELEIQDLLARAWGRLVSYTIAAYNDMTRVGDRVLVGLMAFVPRNSPLPPGHDVVDVGYGRVESGAWYLVRSADAHYDLRRIVAAFAQPLVATRAIRVSPFPGDGDAIYFAGYDANKAPAHNTAWITRTSLAGALSGSP
jgi:hypothetical protein